MQTLRLSNLGADTQIQPQETTILFPQESGETDPAVENRQYAASCVYDLCSNI